MFKVLLADWSADFAMDHEWEKSRIKEATNELESIISYLNFGSEEMPIKVYVQLVREEIVDVEYNMAKLVDLAWGRGLHLVLNLNEEPMKGNDVDDQTIPIIKPPQVHEYAQLLSIIINSKHPLESLVIDVMNMQSSMVKLNKMSISNINTHHQNQ